MFPTPLSSPHFKIQKWGESIYLGFGQVEVEDPGIETQFGLQLATPRGEAWPRRAQHVAPLQRCGAGGGDMFPTPLSSPPFQNSEMGGKWEVKYFQSGPAR